MLADPGWRAQVGGPTHRLARARATEWADYGEGMAEILRIGPIEAQHAAAISAWLWAAGTTGIAETAAADPSPTSSRCLLLAGFDGLDRAELVVAELTDHGIVC